MTDKNAANLELSFRLTRLSLANPVLVASGAGGILPSRISKAPLPGHAPWRMVETFAVPLKSVVLDNDGIDNDGSIVFIEHNLSSSASVETSVIVSLAGGSEAESVGELSSPAIKPVALSRVQEAARAADIPVVVTGGSLASRANRLRPSPWRQKAFTTTTTPFGTS